MEVKVLEEFSKDEFKNELVINEIKDNVTRGKIHEWARQHGYLSRTWYVKDYSQLLLKCDNKKCGKKFISSQFKDVANIDYEYFIDLRNYYDSSSFVCSYCNNTVCPNMDTELQFKWIASDSMLLMKKASTSYQQYKTKEGQYRRRRRKIYK